MLRGFDHRLRLLLRSAEQLPVPPLAKERIRAKLVAFGVLESKKDR